MKQLLNKKPHFADRSGRMLTARPTESEHPGAEIHPLLQQQYLREEAFTNTKELGRRCASKLFYVSFHMPVNCAVIFR